MQPESELAYVHTVIPFPKPWSYPAISGFSGFLRLSPCYAGHMAGRRKIETGTPSLFAELTLDPEQERQVVLEGVDELGRYTGKRPLQCFTIKMPLPEYLEFKRLIQYRKRMLPENERPNCTMTAFVNSAVRNIIIPALREPPQENQPG